MWPAGHFYRDCPKRREYITIKPQHKGYNTNEDNTPDSEPLDNVGAFAASVGLTSRHMDERLIDSGASSHITWEKNILIGYKEFEKVKKSVLMRAEHYMLWELEMCM